MRSVFIVSLAMTLAAAASAETKKEMMACDPICGRR